MIATTTFRYSDYLAIRVRAAGDGASQRRPLRLALLLDVSESMSGERLSAVKSTLVAARELWQPEDRVTLVTFADNARTVVADHTMDAAGVESFYTAVEGLHTDGCTNLSAGLEAVATAVAGQAYDALVILTDGVVNRGLTATAGLQAMAMGLALPVTTLGYGADHNRQLLRDLAIRSHGSYMYCDSDELLPMAIGQLMTELRVQVAAHAYLEVPEPWICQELGGACIGGVVPDRDYWSIWKAQAPLPDAVPAVVLVTGGDRAVATVGDLEEAVVKEQILRCRVARVLKGIADVLETHRLPDLADLVTLEADIATEPESFRQRGLVLRISGEIAAIRAELDMSPVTTPPYLDPHLALQRQRAVGTMIEPPALMARLSSQTAYLTTQRGVSSQAPDEDLFSSPLIRNASDGARSRYRRVTGAVSSFSGDPVNEEQTH